MQTSYLQTIVQENKKGKHCGVYSCCSANYYVIKAVLKKAKETNTIALIEGTSNQINQFGGYTNMTPEEFSNFVESIANEIEISMKQIILGGDHMGPLPWANLDADSAMKNAQELIKQCVLAGFQKIHLDTSMLLGEEKFLTDEIIAKRGAILAETAEKTYKELKKHNPTALPPVYVVGSEVPIPGGVKDNVSNGITTGINCKTTLNAYKNAFNEIGLQEAFNRIIAIVVHLGVEFKATDLDEYDERLVAELIETMKSNPQIAFEGHSTDFQKKENLYKMVENNTAILKVGPALTFALREALFSLECIEKEIISVDKRSNLRETLDQQMRIKPASWEKYYQDENDDVKKILRSFSYLDRIRYYLPDEKVCHAIKTLMKNLDGNMPLYILSQYMPTQYRKVRSGILENNCETLILDKIGEVIDDYLISVKMQGRVMFK